MGNKYIIELEDDKFTNDKGDILYRVKGFNSLLFDDYGLEKLEPLDSYEQDISSKVWHAAHLITNVLSWKFLNDAGLITLKGEHASVSDRCNIFNEFTFDEACEAIRRQGEKVDLKKFVNNYLIKPGDMVYHKRSHISGIFVTMLTDEFAVVQIPSQGDEKQAWSIDNITIEQEV